MVLIEIQIDPRAKFEAGAGKDHLEFKMPNWKCDTYVITTLLSYICDFKDLATCKLDSGLQLELVKTTLIDGSTIPTYINIKYIHR